MEEKKLTVIEALMLAVKNHQEGKLSEAEFIYRKILEIQPDNPDALHLLGVIAHQVGKYEYAIRDISKAIQLKPDEAIYHGNLGMVYNTICKEEEAAESFKRALELNPKYDGARLACYNLGSFFNYKRELEKALEYYNKAIELDSEFAEAHWNKSLILLTLGRFKEGWEEYEYRFKKEEPIDSRAFNRPKWDGSLLQGKRIFVASEQGFGDNIQFVRYISLLKEKEGYVILECRKELRKLFQSLSGVDEFVEKSGSLPEFDFYIHPMSLPRIFNTELENIPNKIPYLKADAELVEKFKASEKFKADEKINFKIGISWAGNPNQENDINRSTTFEKFKILKSIPGVKLFSLQKGEASKQLNDSEIINLDSEIEDFADTAAIIENLDLVIAVDSSVAHLAGAMGKPVWVLLNFLSDWRWLLDKEDNPWYPSMRLFRQNKLGDWDSVFEKVDRELKTLFELNR